jgi:uncharacterized membrane protein
MLNRLNKFVDKLSEFLAARKGLLVLFGILLVVINFILQFFPQIGWLASSDLLLHLGIIIALIGILLAWAL